MSKILNVSIINKNTLVLEKNAQKGDKIDLLSLNNVDLSNIEKQIELGIDNVYNRKLKEKEVFKETDEILKSFDEMRNAILDKQINRLTKEIEDIKNKIENFNIVMITKK